jgi:hypothetical protein
MGMRRATQTFLALLLLSGCDHRPHAPALRDEPIYDNSRDGLRFRSPEGWMEVAKSDPTSDTGDKDYLLVRYQNQPPTATFELSRADLPESQDVGALLVSRSHGSSGPWTPVGTPEELDIGGARGARYVFTNQTMTKETTVVRRRNRVFFFTVVSATDDQSIRQQLRRVVADVKWK